MDTNRIYCRLCAELKPSNKQLDLLSDTEKRIEIILKLSRINAATEFLGSTLPSTVCSECMSSLNKCFDFVISVENAQKVLLEKVTQDNVKYVTSQFKRKTECPTAEILPSVQNDLKIEYDSDDDFKHTENSERLSDSEFIDVLMKSETNKEKQLKPEELFDTDACPSSTSKTWADYSWKCTYCESQFPTINELQMHAQQEHKACNPYRCTDCNFRKGRLDKFLNHVKSHHKEFQYSCYRCFTKFKSLIEARRHKYIHHKTKHSCPGCKTTFENAVQLKSHAESYYQVNKKRIIVPQMLLTNGLTCLQCTKSFKNKGNLKSHVIYMHTDREKNYVCETCGKSCFDKSSLNQHSLIHSDHRPHKCPICKQTFKTMPVLKDHIGRHNEDRPFSCNQCGSRFRLQRDLKKHSAVHSEDMPFHCRYCSKRFQRKQYLTNHERLHTGEKPYSCETCQHSFADWPNYNKHMKQRHNIDTSKKKSLNNS